MRHCLVSGQAVHDVDKCSLLHLQAGEATDLLFTLLDADGTNRISKEEFMHLVTVLKVKWEQDQVQTYLEHHWPRLYHSSAFQAVRRVVLSDAFQYSALHNKLPALHVPMYQLATLWQSCGIAVST